MQIKGFKYFYTLICALILFYIWSKISEKFASKNIIFVSYLSKNVVIFSLSLFHRASSPSRPWMYWNRPAAPSDPRPIFSAVLGVRSRLLGFASFQRGTRPGKAATGHRQRHLPDDRCLLHLGSAPCWRGFPRGPRHPWPVAWRSGSWSAPRQHRLRRPFYFLNLGIWRRHRLHSCRLCCFDPWRLLDWLGRDYKHSPGTVPSPPETVWILVSSFDHVTLWSHRQRNFRLSSAPCH